MVGLNVLNVLLIFFLCVFFFAEPRKDKTDAQHGGNGTLSPNTEQPPCQGSMLPPPGGGNIGNQQNHSHMVSGRDQHDSHTQNSKLERPNTLGTNKLPRRVNVCYEHCK